MTPLSKCNKALITILGYCVKIATSLGLAPSDRGVARILVKGCLSMRKQSACENYQPRPLITVNIVGFNFANTTPSAKIIQ